MNLKTNICGNPIKGFDNTTRLCLRPPNHQGGCNPFSGDPPVKEVEKITIEPFLYTPPENKNMRMVPEGAPGQEQRMRSRKMDTECQRKAVERGQMTFTIVEQDKTAPETILAWIFFNLHTAPAEKLRDAFEDMMVMLFSPIDKKNAD